ncbi:MAG: hypothetical protein BGO78_05220 [Chloroflexi bacterium 44-23]|nr:MAG: hypothetical protein BGO78_05220 [Chloroflexi bacterium 44-23]
MVSRRHFPIGFKITAGLLAFLIILALATSLLVANGFKIAEQSAIEHITGSLQSKSQNSMVQLTSLEAQLYESELQQYADLTRIAADMVVNFYETRGQWKMENEGTHVITSGSQLSLSSDGLLYYDADPNRITEILHPGNVPPDSHTNRSLYDTAILDELFPALLAQADMVVGIYFQGPQLTFRYFPVRNLPQIEIENGAAEAALTMHIETFPVAPQNNPDRKTVWLPPYVDDANQGLLVSANTPIYYGDEFEGYIGVDVSLSQLIERLKTLQPLQSSFAFLVDDKGRLIAAPTEGATRLAGRNLTYQESSPTGLLGLSLDQNRDLALLLTAMKNDQVGATQIDLGGQAVLVTHAPLQETGWTLSIAVPLSELSSESDVVSRSIYNDGRTTVRNTLLAMTGLYLIVIFISIWLSYRYLNRPLRQLLRGVRAVTSGDMNVTVPVTSQDELGELAESFNQMTGELNSRSQQLSQTSNELKIKEAQLKVATLEERQRLARELHDSVSQALYGIALGARTARTQLERDPAKVAEPLDYVLSLAEAGLAEMRALIFELRPESLQNEGLLGALTKVSDAVRTRHKLDIVTSFCSEPDISLDAKEMLYRITQEAIYNVIKHASATRIEITLMMKDGKLILEVRDNGKGFDPQGSFPGHLGLQSMRERVANCNGELLIISQPGQGTTVKVELAL